MTDPNARRVDVWAWPVLRVLASRHFQLFLAFAAVVFGIVLSGVYLDVLSRFHEGMNDFQFYLRAAERIVDGGSMYTAAQMGGPTDAFCGDCYLYPPLFAQLLVPLTYVPAQTANLLVAGALTTMAIASVWLATGIGGAARSLERFLWSTAAALLFVPVFYSNYYGNVGSILALLITFVAMGGAVAGVAATLGMFLKVSPAGLVPAVIAEGPAARRSSLLTIAVVGGISFIIAPQAWIDYLTVLPNLLRGSSAFPDNLALANVAMKAGWTEAAVSAVRAATITAGLLCIVTSVWFARQPGGMPAAALAGTVAMLIIPGTMWPHYVTVLLPFAAMAWPRAHTVPRTCLLLGAVIITLTGLGQFDGWPQLGMLLMIGGSAWVLWPQRDRGVLGLEARVSS